MIGVCRLALVDVVSPLAEGWVSAIGRQIRAEV
jgi:hypothetical protein